MSLYIFALLIEFVNTVEGAIVLVTFVYHKNWVTFLATVFWHDLHEVGDPLFVLFHKFLLVVTWRIDVLGQITIFNLGHQIGIEWTMLAHHGTHSSKRSDGPDFSRQKIKVFI